MARLRSQLTTTLIVCPLHSAGGPCQRIGAFPGAHKVGPIASVSDSTTPGVVFRCATISLVLSTFRISNETFGDILSGSHCALGCRRHYSQSWAVCVVVLSLSPVVATKQATN